MSEKIYDAVVVGTGPAGASVALRLAKAGKKVAMIERGGRVAKPGSMLGALSAIDIMGSVPMPSSPSLVRGICLGGSTLLFCGTAAMPPKWLKEKYKIDLEGYADETVEELDLKPLPDHMLGESGRLILKSANDLGYKWEPFRKFFRPERAKGNCTGGSCMMGCSCGMKWTAAEYADEAVSLGAELFLKTKVEKVLIEDGVTTGVVASNGGQKIIRGKIVILSAGGVGTPGVLLRSGIEEAGKKFFTDPVVMVYGIAKGDIKGTRHDPPMSVGSLAHYDERIVFANLADPWLLLPGMMALGKPTRFWQAFQVGRALGIMVKVGDEMNGEVFKNERVHKPMAKTELDRLKKGAEISTKILVKAGAAPESIVVTPIRLTHPGGTARIGEVVNDNLETGVKNLFCCDASVIPETLDLPVVMTVLCFGKRLADYLVKNNRV
jgi:choline dehydrogenase-like flavoprotein